MSGETSQQQPNNFEAPALLEATRVAKVYGRSGPDSVAALEEVTFSLIDGEFVSVVGPSGCGKSTLMKLIGGLLPPSSGSINYRGQAVKKPQRGMGIVFQTPVLLPWLTVLENVLLPIRVLKTDKAAATERGLSLLEMVGLTGFDSKYPSELSGVCSSVRRLSAASSTIRVCCLWTNHSGRSTRSRASA